MISDLTFGVCGDTFAGTIEADTVTGFFNLGIMEELSANSKYGWKPPSLISIPAGPFLRGLTLLRNLRRAEAGLENTRRLPSASRLIEGSGRKAIASAQIPVHFGAKVELLMKLEALDGDHLKLSTLLRTKVGEIPFWIGMYSPELEASLRYMSAYADVSELLSIEDTNIAGLLTAYTQANQ